MPNVQQPEMRRNRNNPLVQESAGPGAAGHPRSRRGGGEARPVPRDQVSPYGPPASRVAEAKEKDQTG
ncbi:MAG: hypothetical protein DIU79_05855 [Actinobacteria bacterium]|nr:MAG: hypothetical protein DIU79_05855 [Actinomycetota bacterium]